MPLKNKHTWVILDGYFEIGRILHLKSEIGNNLEISNRTGLLAFEVRFKISSFQFEMQDSSDFEISVEDYASMLMT